MEETTGRRAVAEFVGAFTLIFIGGGAGIVSGNDIVAVALANGLAIGIMVTNLGHISGAHFNPAITLGFLATRRISMRLAVVYLVAQLAGATVAAAGLRWLLHKPAFLAAVPRVARIGAGRGVVLEMIMTFFLVWAVFATAVDPRGAFKSIAGLAIGLTITIDVLMGGPLTGAAMNPARAFGPQLVGNSWSDGWIYWVGPVAGALVAALAYEYLYLRPRAALAETG
ncbi:MAG TPA: aquaporin [Gaiellaceae bacterium]|nr:aquaporin [Gaiellaceae bacterium]